MAASNSVFEEAAAILPGLLDADLGHPQMQARRYNLKVWFGPAKPARDHYEAQVIGPGHVADAKVLAIEVGFHAEHPDEKENQATLDRLLARERAWRKVVGPEPVCGPFIGRATHWRRVSETWSDPDLGDPDLPIEIAARLSDYICGLEPLRRAVVTR